MKGFVIRGVRQENEERKLVMSRSCVVAIHAPWSSDSASESFGYFDRKRPFEGAADDLGGERRSGD